MAFNRRAFLNACTKAGIASPLLPGILYTLAAQAQEAGSAPSPAAPGSNDAASPNGGGAAAMAPPLPKVTVEMIDRAAEWQGWGRSPTRRKR